MKRSQLIFVIVVFTAVAVGIVSERANSRDPFAQSVFVAPGDIEFEPLVTPFGDETISGTVVDRAGLPVQGVVVHLHAPDADADNALPLFWTFTNAEGLFRVGGLSPTRYRAILLQPGYPNSLHDIELPLSEAVRWTLPAAIEPIEPMPEIARAPVLGRLAPPVAASDWPVFSYQVLFRPVDGQERLNGATTRRVLTEATGDFRIPDLVQARYEVSVLPLWASGGDWPVLDRVPYQHEGASDELLLLRLRCGEIGGRLFDRQGLPVEGALVRIAASDRPDRPWPAVATDANGRFLATDLPFASYTIDLQAGAWTWSGEAQVRIGARVEVELPPFEARRED